jgi:large subunit ribosomal protein L54
MPSPPAPRQPGAGNVTFPSAISSATPGVSQPLSTPTDGVPEPPKWVNPGKTGAAADAAAVAHEPSSLKVGTVMQGLNYIKNKPEIVALEDHEYPDWLWGLLDGVSKKSNESGGVDANSTFSHLVYSSL